MLGIGNGFRRIFPAIGITVLAISFFNAPARAESRCEPPPLDHPLLQLTEDREEARLVLSRLPSAQKLLAPDQYVRYRLALSADRCADADAILTPLLVASCPEMQLLIDPGHKKPDEAPWPERRGRAVLLSGGYPELAICHQLADLAYLEDKLQKAGMGQSAIEPHTPGLWQPHAADESDLRGLRDDAFYLLISKVRDEFYPPALIMAARLLISYRDRLSKVRDRYPQEAAYFLLLRARRDYGLNPPDFDELKTVARAGLSESLIQETEVAAEEGYQNSFFLERYLKCPWLGPSWAAAGLPVPAFACKAESWEKR